MLLGIKRRNVLLSFFAASFSALTAQLLTYPIDIIKMKMLIKQSKNK